MIADCARQRHPVEADEVDLSAAARQLQRVVQHARAASEVAEDDDGDPGAAVERGLHGSFGRDIVPTTSGLFGDEQRHRKRPLLAGFASLVSDALAAAALLVLSAWQLNPLALNVGGEHR